MKIFKIITFFLLIGIGLMSFSDSKNEIKYRYSNDEVDDSCFNKTENGELHKYYISVSNATYSKSDKSVQMVTRFFIDDMEDVLNSRMENPIVLGDKSVIEEVYPLLKSYIGKKLEVQINGVTSNPSFIAAEYESDQIVLYIELPSPKMPKVITMRFNAFTELFEEQKNLVHMKINGVRRSLLMDKNKLTDTVKF
jgi:hypothetical protein